ncbi:unnamed protein product [Arctogadus glacialis]
MVALSGLSRCARCLPEGSSKARYLQAFIKSAPPVPAAGVPPLQVGPVFRGRSENEYQDVLQEKAHLSLQLFHSSKKGSEYDKVNAEYAQLRETLGTVTWERDSAVQEKNQLQGKLENLEQVLKHMREAAERRQQLELEHEQALAVLNAKQQEIDLLQKAQVEAKKEHEGAVHLLEVSFRPVLVLRERGHLGLSCVREPGASLRAILTPLAKGP